MDQFLTLNAVEIPQNITLPHCEEYLTINRVGIPQNITFPNCGEFLTINREWEILYCK